MPNQTIHPNGELEVDILYYFLFEIPFGAQVRKVSFKTAFSKYFALSVSFMFNCISKFR